MPSGASHAGRGLFLAVLLTAGAPAGAAVSAPPRQPVTVMTNTGEEIQGLFLGATESEVTVETQGRKVTLPLRDVSYLAFAGRPPSGAPVSYSGPSTPAAQLRLEGAGLESEGRLTEALARYEEAARLDPSDALTQRALERTRQKIRVREGRERAADFKRLTVALKDARRYPEAAACFDEAMRLDPTDEKFYRDNRAIRESWAPSSCPADKTAGKLQ